MFASKIILRFVAESMAAGRNFHREMTCVCGSKALVLDILWRMCAADRIAQEQFALDKAFALIEGHPLSGVSRLHSCGCGTPSFDKEFTRHRHSS
jgi:hypothetical protein